MAKEIIDEKKAMGKHAIIERQIIRSDLIASLNITSRKLESLGIEPYAQRKSSSTGYTCHLFPTCIAGIIRLFPDYTEKRSPKSIDYSDLLDKKYAGKVEQLEQDAFSFMFSLNRYAKHQKCSKNMQEAIYELKDVFLRKATATINHTTERHFQIHEARECNRCYGDGCEHCDDTGYYRQEEKVHFLCFYFEVGGKAYSFHTPEKNAKYDFTQPIDATEKNFVKQGEKPLAMRLDKLKIARETVRLFTQQP